VANLYDVLVHLMAKPQRRPGAGGADALYQPGTVLAINADGTYVVDLNGTRVTANPETDYPHTVGQRVNVSEVRNGKPVIHGPR
jgi:membrane protein implicated in regulation of membrane protease activity